MLFLKRLAAPAALIAGLALILPALVLPALASPALALDANDFAKKLTEVFAAAGSHMVYDSASAEGERVVLDGVSMQMAGAMPAQFKGRLVVEGVREQADGGYQAQSARLNDVVVDEEGTEIAVNNVAFTDLTIAADPTADPLASMRLYKQVSLGPIAVRVSGKTVLEIAKITSNTDVGPQDKRTKSRFQVDGLKLDPAVFEDQALSKTLAGYGIDKISGQLHGEADWQLDTGRLDVVQSVLQLDKLGTLDVSGFVTGYDLDLVKQMMATQRQMQASGSEKMSMQKKDEMEQKMFAIFAQKLALGQAKVRYDDAGLVPKVLDGMAADSGMPASTLGGFYAGMAAAMAAQAGMPQTVQTQIIDGLTRFFKDPKNLTISVSPKQPVPFSSLAGLGDNPQQGAALLNPEITANQ